MNHLTEHMFDISNLHNFSIFDGAAARSPIRDFSVNPRPIRHTQIFPKTAAQNFIRDYLKILHLTKTQFCAIIKVTVNFLFFLNKKDPSHRNEECDGPKLWILQRQPYVVSYKGLAMTSL